MASLPFELQELQKAVLYQQWMIDSVRPFLGKRILELGSGIGNMSQWFLPMTERLILTEADPDLLTILSRQIGANSNSSHVSFHHLNLSENNLQSFHNENIDTIISFNVLEHIEDDGFVLRNCAELLRQSKTNLKKRIITFVPAHQWAYGVMDKAGGHYRRYNCSLFKDLHKQCSSETRLTLLSFNFVGVWGWLVNGRLLRRQCAGGALINFVNACAPVFKIIDSIVINTCRIPIGQSLIAIQEW